MSSFYLLAVLFVPADAPSVEQWGHFELALNGPATGNPFVETTLSARFTRDKRAVEAAGFYDGNGVYRVRFMPDAQGVWTYETKSNRPELNGKKGTFIATAPKPGNRGPVRVRNTYHFAYADGSPYYPFGTTCYAWTHQDNALQEQTLASLKASPFNKLRFCVFPKDYAYNRGEPPFYPFAGSKALGWEYDRFQVDFFQHLEKRVAQLRDLGIEADVILFHPYDKGRWGFDRMSAEADDRYLRHVIARLAAYRNVWWSLANEYDFMEAKKTSDWDRLFRIVAEADPYARLRSIHNGRDLYNHTQPWVTHVSLQNGSAVADFGRAGLYRDVYRKPIVLDEVKYEGDIEQRWGNLSAEEMVHRFWQGTIAGTYVGHGETYRRDDEILWWSKGGVLRGKSPPRIAFLRKVVEEGPAEGIEPIDKWQDERTAGKKGEYYLVYFGKEAPGQWTFQLPAAGLSGKPKFRIEILDTWEMKTNRIEEVVEARAAGRYAFRGPNLTLPGKPYLALRVRRVP